MSKQMFQAVAAILLGIAVSGCGSSRGGRDPYFANTATRANVFITGSHAHVKTIAVMPFKGPTSHIGESVSDLVVTEMLRLQRYEVVERSRMAQVLGETELALSGLSDAGMTEVAQMAGADAVVVGSVDEYGTIAVKGTAFPSVGMTLRMIDCASGKVLWSVDDSQRAQGRGTPLSAHARKVVHEMVSAVYQAGGRIR